MWNISCKTKKETRTELQIETVTCSNEDIKRISVHILLLNLRRSYPNLWGITASASWHHIDIITSDVRISSHFKIISSWDRLSEFYPWVAAVGNRVVKHHLSPDLLALKRCSLNWCGQIGEKKQSLRENNLSCSIHFHFDHFHMSFSFFSCSCFHFFSLWLTRVIHICNLTTQSADGNHSPLTLRKWHLQPISQIAQTPFPFGFFWHFFRECFW